MRKLIFLFLLSALTIAVRAGSIGTWRAYLSYDDITSIEKGQSLIYVLASGNLYSYNPSDQEVLTYDKTRTLNGCVISAIRWNTSAKRLLVVYEDGNIDIMDEEGNVLNVSDYYSKSMTGDKTIYNIENSGKYAYLCTGFGIVKLNMATGEISDTYNLGMKVCDMVADTDYLYASTKSGLFRARTTANLVDKNEWKKCAGWTWDYLFKFKNELYGAFDGNVNVLNVDKQTTERVWTPRFKNISVSDDRVIFCNHNAHTYIYQGRDKRYDIPQKYAAITYDASSDSYWANGEGVSLANISINLDDKSITNLLTGINPEGPLYNHFACMRYANGVLMSVPGTGSPTRAAQVQMWDGDKWTFYDDSFTDTLSHRYIGHTDFAVDPTDKSRVMVCGQTGLYEFVDGQLRNHWNFYNSPLRSAYTVGGNNPEYTIVYTLAIDGNGTTWLANSISATTSLFSLSKDGVWTSHHSNSLMANNRSFDEMRSMMFDSRGLLWWVNDYHDKPSLICYNTSTDELKVYSSFVNEDGTSVAVTYVRCVAEDLEHNIWIGTNVGPLMLQASEIASGGETFYQVKVPRNDGTNLADYLLSGVDIRSIAIDGGGRKWMGTNTAGAYLISADNMEQLQHFTTSDSPLLNDAVESVAINGDTGEVFFGTMSGLCSYMSDASQPSEKMTKDNVYAYPNPVRPDYTGLITVVGLTLNADVKIVTANGSLVAEGRSSGGTFTWDGRDKRGRRVASGVYMVQTATSEGGKGTVCKIAIVN